MSNNPPRRSQQPQPPQHHGQYGAGGAGSGGGDKRRYGPPGGGRRRSRSPPPPHRHPSQPQPYAGGYYAPNAATMQPQHHHHQPQQQQMMPMHGGAAGGYNPYAAGTAAPSTAAGDSAMNAAMLMNAAAAGGLMPMGMWPAMAAMPSYYGDHPAPQQSMMMGAAAGTTAPYVDMMGGRYPYSHPAGSRDYPGPPPPYNDRRYRDDDPYYGARDSYRGRRDDFRDDDDDYYYRRRRDDDRSDRGGRYGGRRSRSPPPRRGDNRRGPPPSRGGSHHNEPASSAEARENPSRTLFVRNLDFNTTEERVKEIFEKFGEIKNIFNQTEKRGMVFISYYDLRAAEKAIKEMHKKPIDDRVVDVHYSVPKDEDLNSKTCDRTKNQGTILLTLKDGKEALRNERLRELFGKFGDLKVVREFKNHPNQRFIEFWDSRHCLKAVDELHGSAYNGGTLDLRFAWDIPRKARRADGPPDSRRESRQRSPDRDRNQPPSRDDQSDTVSQSQWSGTVSAAGMPTIPLNPAQQAHEQLMSLTAAMTSTQPTSNEQQQPAPASGEGQTQVVAQMTQLLQLLQQNPVTANALTAPPSTTPSTDPRILDAQDNVASDPDLSKTEQSST